MDTGRLRQTAAESSIIPCYVAAGVCNLMQGVSVTLGYSLPYILTDLISLVALDYILCQLLKATRRYSAEVSEPSQPPGGAREPDLTL